MQIEQSTVGNPFVLQGLAHQAKTQGQGLGGGSTSTTNTPFGGRVLVLVHRYKSLLGSQNSLAADKPSLMLDVKTDLPFKEIRKIMIEFAHEPVRDEKNLLILLTTLFTPSSLEYL